MKFAKQEILRVLLILGVQMITSFMIAYFTDITWNLKSFTSNYMFIVFWVTYAVCRIGVAFFKRVKSKKVGNI